MRLPEESYRLWARQSPPPPQPTTTPAPAPAPNPNQPASVSHGAIIAAATVGGLALALIVTYLLLRGLRQRHSNPKYIPTKFFKERWKAWAPNSLHLKYLPSLQRRGSSQEMQTTSPTSTQAARRARPRTTNGVDRDSAVDRHTSVRSIITLPPYSADAGENERILGREGEREGIDTVVEFPETEMEAEDRREDEMQSLYEIRQVRREERSARNDRRRRRQEAISTNDTAALEQLRRERRERNATNNTTSQDLIAEHEHRDRRERLAEVEYADLGLARPDGSRIRANSAESSRPLLGAAARPGHNRQASGGPYTQHQANQSVSSLRFAMTPDISDDEGDSTGVARTRTRSRGDSTGDYSIRSQRPWLHGNDFSQSRVTLATVRTQDTLDTVESGQSHTAATEGDSGRAQPSVEAPPPEYETIDLNASSNASRTTLPSIRTAVPDEDAPPYSSPTQTLPGVSPIQPPPPAAATSTSPSSSDEPMHTPRSALTIQSAHDSDSPPQIPELNVPSIEITPNTPVPGGSRPTSSGAQ